MRRIAFISVHGCPVARLGERDTGGMNVSLYQLAQKLGQLGLPVDVYTRVHDPADPQVVTLGENARVIHLPAGPYGETKEGIFRYLPTFIDQLERFRRRNHLRYHLVHSHYWLSGHVGAALASQWRVPHTTTFHTLARVKLRARAGERELPLRINRERAIVATADRVVATTNHEREALIRLYGARPERIRVVPCGVDLEMFRPIDRWEARHKLGLNGNKLLLYVGRIEPLKGLELLLRSISRLDGGLDWTLLVVGGNRQGDGHQLRLKELANELGVAEQVTFVGSQPQSRLPDYYSAADLCVVPSYYESFGLVALEAMACGTPVIGRRVGGLTTVVQHGRTGYLIPWHCPEPLAEGIEVLLRNESLRQAMGKAAREWACLWSWQHAAKRLMKVYQELWSMPKAAF